jgi:hypothetical protein
MPYVTSGRDARERLEAVALGRMRADSVGRGRTSPADKRADARQAASVPG